MRRFVLDDADFILELLNDPGWIEHIGDRGVRTLDDARAYLAKGPLAMYERLGFGLYLVTLASTGERIGMCGLVKREGLDDVDIGFAFLPAWRRRGYAVEASRAVLEHARDDFGMTRIVAIVSETNPGSIRVLEKLGLASAGKVKLPRDDGEILLYAAPLT
jgi:RimJ/RimL family protein N-acetyltransferase